MKCQKKVPADLYDVCSMVRLRGPLTRKVLRLLSSLGINGAVVLLSHFSHFMSFSHHKLCYKLCVFSADSDAVWQGEVVLLSVSDQRTAVDLAPDPLLYHLPPVELQARVHCVHAHGGKVWKNPINWRGHKRQ